MCTVVKIVNGDQDIWNITKLKDNNLFVSEADRPSYWNDDLDCLCGVNIEAILKRCGYLYEYNPTEDTYTVFPKKKNK